MADYKDVFSTLNSDDYHTLRIEDLSNNDILKKIINVKNPVIFDRFVKLCEYKIDTSPLYEARNRFIRKIVLNITEDNMCEIFDVNDKVLANRYLIEYIIYYYFGDSYYNFMVNFHQMEHYLAIIKKDLVSKTNIALYKEFVNLRYMSFKDKIYFFKLFLDDINIMEMFYDDLTIVREDSHKNLVDNTLKLNINNDVYSEGLSNQKGVPIYYLNGEEFYGFMRHVSLMNDEKENSEYIYSRKKRLGYSFTYISSHNMGTMDYDGKSVLLYYDSIDYRNIMYVHHTDMSTGIIYEQDRYISSKENEIFTPKGLISHTRNYNEIYIKPGIDGIKPSALICYDMVKDDDISFAKRYNLSILIINTKKYKRYQEFRDDYDSYTYVI